MRRHLRACQPDAGVAQGWLVPPLTERGLTRQQRDLLLRLRIGCHKAAARWHRLGLAAMPDCSTCGEGPAFKSLLAYLDPTGLSSKL
ncbi:hypothetical protein MRX96_029349 [Rhipicephalus microplus]